MRITFPPPGFFINDPRLTVLVNGWSAHDGSFKSGFDVRFPVIPGYLTVQTRIAVLGMGRERAYQMLVNPGWGLELRLDYSRFTGNFAELPAVRQVPPGAY
jgi:hypothetical protein